MSRTLIFWLAVLFVFAGVTIFAMSKKRGAAFRDVSQTTDVGSHREVDEDYVPPSDLPPLEDFDLTDHYGRDFSSQSLEGKIWIGSVFFSTCPSTCRMQNMRVAELQQLYGDRGLEFVSVTCDPETDTPVKLNDYSQIFSAQKDKWHFLTGDFGLIQRVGGEKFGITIADKVHSDRLILFDRDGNRVNSFRSLDANEFLKLKQAIEAELEKDEASDHTSDDSPSEDSKPALENAEAVEAAVSEG